MIAAGVTLIGTARNSLAFKAGKFDTCIVI